MHKYILILATIVFAATSAQADMKQFPALYDVTGVASDDVLNVRAGTGASHPIIEALSHNDRDIEIIRLSSNGKWGLIGYPGGNGWASMRYLKRQNGQTGSNVPRPLNCGGNEPFWGITFGPNSTEFLEPGQMSQALGTLWQGIPDGMQPVAYGAKLAGAGGEINAVITRSECSDGMSERAYGFEINALLSGTFGNRMLTGCCLLTRP